MNISMAPKGLEPQRISPVNSNRVKSPFSPKNASCLRRVCSPVVFSLLVHYYYTYRWKTAVKGEFPFRPQQAKKEFLV